MTYLVRKISRAKWGGGDTVSVDDIPADAVTNDLRTSGNTLSFWKCETPEDTDAIKKVALALAAEAERINKIDLAWVEEDSLKSQGISVEESKGLTPVVSLQDLHVDLTNLNLDCICVVGRSIADTLNERQHIRFTQKQVLQIIVDAVKDRLVSVDSLKEKVQREVNERLSGSN